MQRIAKNVYFTVAAKPYLHGMTTTMRQIIITVVTSLVLTNVHGQTNTNVEKDTTLSQLSYQQQLLSDKVPRPIGWINDFEGLFTNDQVFKLNEIVRTFKNETGIELAIVTLDSTFVTLNNFDELTLRMANEWGVGTKGKNNGIFIGISRGHRKMRINNGLGIEKIITDKETKDIIDNYFIPSFKNGKYYDGTLTGLSALIKLLETKLK